ncbi:hypothetical protein AMTR_s00148p00022180 [Amborella trichopoda]|uniref:Uncharacterized protein n=1 Tax=Amborella trichopoda TaxID=13333 RepID=W1PMF6_AMBTC|nr:hypothetical protein AMTR_s00148p00022180 [Amborella trichopoda]
MRGWTRLFWMKWRRPEGTRACMLSNTVLEVESRQPSDDGKTMAVVEVSKETERRESGKKG